MPPELADRLHLLRLDQLLLRALTLAEIVDDADEDRLAVLRRLADRKVHREGRAVLAATLHLAADADDLCLTGSPVVAEVAVVLAAVRLGHQHLDVLPDDLGRPVAEQLLAGRVEHEHGAGRVDQDHPVDGGLDHRAKPRFLVRSGHVSLEHALREPTIVREVRKLSTAN